MVVLWKKRQNPEDTGSVRFHFKSEQNFKVKLILTDRIKAIDKSHTFLKKKSAFIILVLFTAL